MLGASVAGYALVRYGSIDRVGNIPLAQAAAGEPENYLIVGVDPREGHQTNNTDTIMVVRVDPQSDRLALTSFPRDLMVEIADTGERGMINAAYNRAGDEGPRVLTETIQLNFGITINHYIEVNFESFKQVVDAVGGVPVWIPYAVRDDGSGLYIEERGCLNLDGQTALEFARARKLKIQDEDGDWVQDPLSDLNRVNRQQIFIRRAMTRVLADVKANPLRLRELLDIGVANVRFDEQLTIGDMLDLGERFQGFDAGKLETYALPTFADPQNAARLVLDDGGAEPMLNVFRGLAPGEISPGLVNVTVLNGTVADEAQHRQNLAADVSSALHRVGFEMGEPANTDTFYAQTTIQYAPGQAVYAQRVARHISSATAIPTVENPDLEPGHVTVIAGLDFTTVHDQATPIEAMPVPAGAEAPTETTVAETTTTTAAPPPVTTTTTNPYVIGEPPEGADC